VNLRVSRQSSKHLTYQVIERIYQGPKETIRFFSRNVGALKALTADGLIVSLYQPKGLLLDEETSATPAKLTTQFVMSHEPLCRLS
jgi:hypothetical protein